MKSTKTFWAALIFAAAAWGQDALQIHLTVRDAGGLTEILPGMDADGETLAGDRGCADGLDQCAGHRRIMAARQDLRAGDNPTVFVAGEGSVEGVSVRLGNRVVFEQSGVSLPVEIPVHSSLVARDVLTVLVSLGGADSVQLTASVADNSKAGQHLTVSSVSIKNYVQVYYSGIPGGFYEVIEGSGTGGRFHVGVRGCVYPGYSTSNCPWGMLVQGYTDRAQRGEAFCTVWNGYGDPEQLGWKYKGSGKTRSFNPPYLWWVEEWTISTNANDDNLYSFVRDPYYEKRVPLGTRP